MPEQNDLLEWGDSQKVIRQQPPSNQIQHREFIKEQLRPIMDELEALGLSLLAISEAMAFYQGEYKDKAQESLINE